MKTCKCYAKSIIGLKAANKLGNVKNYEQEGIKCYEGCVMSEYATTTKWLVAFRSKDGLADISVDADRDEIELVE